MTGSKLDLPKIDFEGANTDVNDNVPDHTVLKLDGLTLGLSCAGTQEILFAPSTAHGASRPLLVGEASPRGDTAQAMSPENVELFRRSLDAFNRGDLEGWLASIHPDISFAPIRTPIEGVYKGHAGIRRFFADNQESFNSFRLDYTEIRDIGDDRLLVIGTLHLRARGSRIETDVPTAAIATARDGLLIRWKDYGDPHRALQAAGLSE